MKRQTVRNNDVDYSKLYTRDSDDDGEETELLYIRKTKNVYKEVPTIEKVVQGGDTLQALSITYHCSIAELKRLNNMHNDNEIFARNTIKVPARVFSKTIAGVHNSGNSSPNDKVAPLPEIDRDLLQSRLKDTFNSLENDFNTVIFNSSISSRNNDSNNEAPEADEEEEVCLIPNEPIPVVVPVPSRFSCSGADADIPWISLIVCIVVLIVAVPIIYTVYIAEHLEAYHHKHS